MSYLKIKNRESSIISRARARSISFVFSSREYSTGLIIGALALPFILCGMAKTPPLEKIEQRPIASTRFDDLIEIAKIQVKRTNPINGAYELVSVDEKEATVTRSTRGFRAKTQLEEQQFSRLAENLIEAGEITVYPHKSQHDLEVHLTVFSNTGKRDVILDPTGDLNSLYTEIMELRNKALSNAN